MSDIPTGLRVVRGVDWQWGNQDGGEGCVGTVIQVGGQGSNKNPSGTVVVVWDSGDKANYRAGYDGKDDLRVLDNAQAGVYHHSILCDECKASDIWGIRWKCAECDSYDICHVCYMSDKHNTNHAFSRIDTLFSESVKVPPRAKSKRLSAKGVYVGARVVRGPHWNNANEDGGPGKCGYVTSVGNSEDGTSSRSWVDVKWESGTTKTYHRGSDGMMDVKCTTVCKGEDYFVDHLPRLCEYRSNIFSVGDSVRLRADPMTPAESAAFTQEGVLTSSGRVTEFNLAELKIKVHFSSSNSNYCVPSFYLEKRPVIGVGDTVKITDDADTLQKLQAGHGGYTDQMLTTLGKTGKVIRVDSDGDLKVDVDGKPWIFNPDCCTLVSACSAPATASARNLQPARPVGVNNSKNTTSSDDGDDDATNALSNRLRILLVVNTGSSADPSRLVADAAQGREDNVRAILNRYPQEVNRKLQNKTALQVASYQGHLTIVAMLLSAGADPAISDEDGDTSYHYAVFGNQPVALESLLKSSTAAINAVNKVGRTALHLAAMRQTEKCVHQLLSFQCNVNIQDKNKETALHEAIKRPSAAIVKMILSSNAVDMRLHNSNGFTVIHHAALHGNQYAMALMVAKAPASLVNEAKSDGFTALHIAALNGYPLTAAALIDSGKANLEAKTSKQQTPLLIAICNGELPLVELLVLKGANLEAEDSDGDTALHNTLLILKNSRQQAASLMTFVLNVMFQVQPKHIEKTKEIYHYFQQFRGSSNSIAWIAVACFLTAKGADVYHRNKAGKTPLDEVGDQQVKDLLLKLVSKRATMTPAPKPSPSTPSAAKDKKCMMCGDEPICVMFRPCGHSVTCFECSSNMKQCFDCHQQIQEKVFTALKFAVFDVTFNGPPYNVKDNTEGQQAQ